MFSVDEPLPDSRVVFLIERTQDNNTKFNINFSAKKIKGFSWSQYLEQEKGTAAPSKLFKDVSKSLRPHSLSILTRSLINEHVSSDLHCSVYFMSSETL